MSLFCSSSSSTSGTIVSKLAPRQVLPFLYPVDFIQRSHRQSRLCSQVSKRWVPKSLEAWFIRSLLSAGECPKHRTRVPQPSTYFTSHRADTSTGKLQIYNAAFRRQQHTKASPPDPSTDAKPNRTKEELLELVDQYSGKSYTDQLPLLELPTLYQPGDGPYLTVSDKIEDEWPPPHYTWPANPETKITLQNLEKALRDIHKDPEEIFQLYRKLPAPRAPYLEAKIRHRFLQQLSVVERKDERSMLRYFSIIDDMKGTAIPLNISEWTSALSFAARYVARSTDIEVEAALVMWREMEHVAGVKGNDATFNVLYDVACKAGKFTLAEMIYKEMEVRGFEFNRYHHVSMIHSAGLKGDGDGARAAYKALVEAGEIVDTVVLNAMISALINANEAGAAENVYERMKKIHIERTGSRLPPRDYKTRRQINYVLMRMARMVKIDPSRREEFQQQAIIAPNTQTYRILINYFAVRAGELDKTAKFLDEMNWFEVPLHGAMFLALLKGFTLHGGIRYTHWTEARLESVWRAFVRAIDAGTENLYISKWLVIWALKAFSKCSGKARTVGVWEEIKQQWNPDEADMEFVMSNLRTLLEGEDVAKKNKESASGADQILPFVK